MKRHQLLATGYLCLSVLAAACSNDPQKLKEKHVKAAQGYVAAKKYEQAVIEYANALKQDRNAGDVHFAMAEAYMAAGNTRAAFPEYVSAADLLPENAQAQLKAGQLLFKGGLFDQARNRARTVLQANPRNVEALLLLGNALAGLKDLQNAIGTIERAVQIDPERAGLYSNLAVLRMAQGETKEAETAFAQAVKVSGESPTALVSLGNYYRASGRVADAERLLSEAYTKDPKNIQANEALAGLYMQTRRFADAEKHLKVVAGLTGDPEPRFALASYYAAVGRIAEATKTLEGLAADKSQFAKATLQMALLDYAAGDQARAHQRVDSVISREPRNTDALTLKGRLLLADHQPEEAMSRLQTALAADPRLAAAHLTLGRALLALGRGEEARKSFSRALDSESNYLPALLELAELHLGRRDLDSALQFADIAAKNHPNSLPARMALVRILLMRGDKGAGDQIQALRARFPAASPVHSAAGALALANNDLSSATPSFQRALQLNPRSFEAVSGLVAIDLANKRFAEAKARVQTLLTPPPSSATPLMLAATVYGLAGEPDTTEKLLRQALDVEPSNPEVYGRLGELFVAQGRLDEARKEFNELSRLQPRSIGALSISGLLAYMQHDYPQARQRWEQALKVDPTAAAAANNLAWLYAETGGNLDIALQLAQTAKAQFSDSAEVDDTIGWIQLKRGLTALSLNYLERAVEKVPGNPSFQYHLGMAYAKQGEDGKARQALQQALKVSTTFDGAADARKTLATLVY